MAVMHDVTDVTDPTTKPGVDIRPLRTALVLALFRVAGKLYEASARVVAWSVRQIWQHGTVDQINVLLNPLGMHAIPKGEGTYVQPVATQTTDAMRN